MEELSLVQKKYPAGERQVDLRVLEELPNLVRAALLSLAREIPARLKNCDDVEGKREELFRGEIYRLSAGASCIKEMSDCDIQGGKKRKDSGGQRLNAAPARAKPHRKRELARSRWTS